MTLTVTNQKPAELNPQYTLPVTGKFDPLPAVRHVLAEPAFTPINANNPVVINDAKGRSYDHDAIVALVLNTLGPQVDPDAEDTLKDLLYQTMIHFDLNSPLLSNEVFANQSGAQNKMPAPTQSCVYTPQTDIIPAARKFLGGNVDGSEFFAAIAFAFHPNTLGFYFANNAAFNEFKEWLAAQVTVIQANLPGDTVQLLQQFQQLDLKALTEGLTLRADDSEGNDEYSFARIILYYLMSYASLTPANQFGIMPFTLGELFVPRSIVFVNVEAHARARPNRVNKEWQLIVRSIASPVKIISNKQLSKLTALSRAAQKAQSAAANSQSNKFAPHGRSAKVKFRKNPPKGFDLSKHILRVLKRMAKVNKSMNIYTSTKSTFVKANRRDPDDYNKPGKITSIHYLPDIHVFVDTSGSISESNYQGTVMMLIRMAKKMNVDLYFSSFSHMLSQEYRLHTKDKSVKQIWEEFRRIPKVSGGTDYQQIWDYINISKTRKKRFSLIITDFEWRAAPERIDHPKNLYYAPCAGMDWPRMSLHAKEFAKSVKHSDPAIAQRLLGMIY